MQITRQDLLSIRMATQGLPEKVIGSEGNLFEWRQNPIDRSPSSGRDTSKVDGLTGLSAQSGDRGIHGGEGLGTMWAAYGSRRS